MSSRYGRIRSHRPPTCQVSEKISCHPPPNVLHWSDVYCVAKGSSSFVTMAFMMVGNPQQTISVILLDIPGHYQKSSCSKIQLITGIRAPDPQKKNPEAIHPHQLSETALGSPPLFDTRYTTSSLPVANLQRPSTTSRLYCT